jgi:hypothetical protein
VDPLTLTIVLSLFNPHINLTFQIPFKFFILLYILFVIYIVALSVVRPRSCRVIYYFDTPALGIRHQSFDHVTLHQKNMSIQEFYSAMTDLWDQLALTESI